MVTFITKFLKLEVKFFFLLILINKCFTSRFEETVGEKNSYNLNKLSIIETQIQYLNLKISSLNEQFKNSIVIQNLIYTKLVDQNEKLEKILTNTKKEKINSNNDEKNYLNKRILVGRSIPQEDFNEHFNILDSINKLSLWQNRTDYKLTKMMNVITEIYKEDKKLSSDLFNLNEIRNTKDDFKSEVFDKIRKDFKEQFSINKAELKSYISNVNENCLRTKTQNDNLTFLILGIKDDLMNPLKFNKVNTENLIQKSSLYEDKNFDSSLNEEYPCKNINNVFNSSIESLRFDLNIIKNQIFNRIDKENNKINERLYMLNNNYQHLNNLRNCNNSKNNDHNLKEKNDLNDFSDNYVSDSINLSKNFEKKNFNNAKNYIQKPKNIYSPNYNDNNLRSKTTEITKLIDPVREDYFKNHKCHKPYLIAPANCEELYKDGRADCDGIYVILLKNLASRVYCEMKNQGFTVIMRRGQFNKVPITSFDESFSNYKKGFGNLDADFWLGLDKIYELTSSNDQMLQIDLESFDGDQITLNYNLFKVESESNNYRLNIGEPYGSNQKVAKSFLQHNGSFFYTKDKDNFNCARKFEAGWWFLSMPQCHTILLNGYYFKDSSYISQIGIQWPTWKSNQFLKSVQMKIKKRLN